MHIQDIAQNSIAAKATEIGILVSEDSQRDILEIEIKDNGCGMSAETIQRVIDPFYTTRTTRKVGLGIPLFKMAAEMTGGRLDIESKIGEGTAVRAVFTRSHIDRAPLGDMESAIAQLICLNEDINITYHYKLDGAEFAISTDELKNELDGVPLSAPQVMQFVSEYIRENSG